MRNSGWYIPFWRKPKRGNSDGGAERPEKERKRRPKARSDEELERVRTEWVTRYTRQLHALRLMGLSVGTPQDEVVTRYRELVARANHEGGSGTRLHELHEAYEALRQPE